MVVKRIFLALILGLLLFNTPLYALKPYSAEEEVVSNEAKEEIERTETEKKSLIEEVLPLREERSKNLRPYVYEAPSSDIEAAPPARRVVKGFVPEAPEESVSKSRFPVKPVASRPLANLIFFSLIIIAFLAAYYFIRPKP